MSVTGGLTLQYPLGAASVDPWPNVLTSPLVWGGDHISGDANRAYLTRIERRATSITISALTVGVGVQAGNLDVGIYTHSAGTWTRTASSGAVAVGAAGGQTVNLTASYEIAADTDYWLALAISDATAELAGNKVPQVAPTSFALFKDASFPLPATITTPTANTAFYPLIVG